MEDRLHPLNLSELDSWRKHNDATMDEARKRFVQFVVLESVALDSGLKDILAFKGGNALRFIHRNPRGTSDLDFTARDDLPDEEDYLREALNRVLRQGNNIFGIRLKCQRVNRKPPKKKATLPTYDIAIGYQFPGDRYFADFATSSKAVSEVVQIEISFNDLVCETELRQLSPTLEAQVRVCSLEDILAEKLRAMLQQVIRNRNRPQDVFDIAWMMREHAASLDFSKIANFLTEKCKKRGIEATRSAFGDEDVRKRSSYGYDTDLIIHPTDRIPFEDAWEVVMALVAKLSIPES